MTKERVDVVIIGAGAIGSALARELSKYELNVVLLEKNEDVGGDASKSNNATVICGYDAPPGTLESRLTVASNPMFDKVCAELDVPFKRIGMLQLAFSEEDKKVIEANHKQAFANGVFDVELLDAPQVRKMEPNISDLVQGALFVPRESIVNVFELLLAYTENAAANGVDIRTSTRALRIITKNGKVDAVETDKGEIKTRFVINAAALYADEIAKTVNLCNFRNYPRKGQIFILDKNLSYAPNHILAPTPTPLTRGKLITPSIDGNLILGPTAENLEDKVDKSTSAEGLESILEDVRRMIPEVDPKDSVTQFAGLRPARDPKEYSIKPYKELYGYVEVNGISQGVSCSLSTSKYVVELLKEQGLQCIRKTDFNPYRKQIVRFNECSREKQAQLIKENPKYGNIICRCETISEAEILEAIRRGAKSMDGVKRRVRAGMGRCQGGFCSSRVLEILARELNIKPEDVCKNEPGSELLVGQNRKGGC